MHSESHQNLIVIEGRATYERITNALRDAETDEAVTNIKNFLKIYPEFAQAHNDLAVYYYKAGDNLKALAHYEKAHKLAPKNITFLKNLADFYMVELEWADDAIHIYLDILKDNPFDVEALNALGAISRQIGRKEQARQYFSRALQLDSNSREARSGLNQLGLPVPEPQPAAQQPARAEELRMPSVNQQIPVYTAPPVEPVPQTVKPDPEARYRAAVQMAGLGRQDEAVSELELLIADSQDHALAHNDLGVLYQQAGKMEQALEQHQQAARLAPDNPVLQKNLADLLFIGFSQYEKALEIYVSLLAKAPKDAEVLKAIAQVCVELGQLDNAAHFLERVLAVQPWDQEARAAVKQIEDSKKSVVPTVSSASPEEMHSQAQQLVADNKPAEACALLEQLVARYDNFAVAHNDLGVLRYQLGNIQGACSSYEKAVELDPQNASFRKNLADLCFVEMGRTDEAIGIYLQLLKENPRNVETLENLGHISVAIGRPDEARAFYRRALEIEPWNTGVRTALQDMNGNP